MTVDESVYAHDWRFCWCRVCDETKRDYEQEMGS